MEYLTQKHYNYKYFNIYRENGVIYITFEDLICFLKDLPKKKENEKFKEEIEFIPKRYGYDCKIAIHPNYNSKDAVISIPEVIDLMGDYEVSGKLSKFLLWLSNLPMLLR